MEVKLTVLVAILSVISVFLVKSAMQWMVQPLSAEDLLADVTAPQDLKDWVSSVKPKRVEKVFDGAYSAVGYALGNVIILEGPDGLVVIDTTENPSTGREVLRDVRKITQKPIKAIIYTHNHLDHTNGAEAFVEDPANPPDIWAHDTLLEELRSLALTGNAYFIGAQRQFGVYLPDVVNEEVNVVLKFDKTQKSAPLMPNKFASGYITKVNIAGLDLELLHLPGETKDQLAIYWPEKKTLMPGDNIYEAFPNLYAIRGTRTRNVMQWAHSLDIMRSLKLEHLIPSHMMPVSGHQEIQELLTVYRDALQFVNDQTIRFMNKGMHPEDIVRHVNLPPKLAAHPYLQPHYGTVHWSVKGVVSAYMGWFTGDIEELSPLHPLDKAEKIVELAGGRNNVLVAAERALAEKNYPWALELASYLFKLKREDIEARALRFKCLKALAHQQTSVNGRNYYLSKALEDHGLHSVRLNSKEMAMRVPLDVLFAAMTVKVKSEECGTYHSRLQFHFTDTQENFMLELRNGILEVEEGGTEAWDVKARMTSTVWREVLAKRRSPVSSYTAGDIVIEGGIMSFNTFMGCFEQDD